MFRVSHAAIVAVSLLLTLTGCPPNGGGKLGAVPRTVEEAVDRVNANLSKIDTPLYCKDASISFSFKDKNGTTRNFVGHPATIIFQPQRDLYFDIKASLTKETVAHVGSNSDLYWFFVDVGDSRKLWYGEWAALGDRVDQRLPIPPDDLLDALMFRPLPRTLAGGVGPVLRIDNRDHRLVYLRVNEATRASVGFREIRLDANEPQQPVEIIDRDRNGRVLMHAWLSDYRRVRVDDADTGPWTARKYKVEWPQAGSSMTLDVSSAKFRPDQPPFSDFPTDWSGEIENLDEAAPPPSGGSVSAAPTRARSGG